MSYRFLKLLKLLKPLKRRQESSSSFFSPKTQKGKKQNINFDTIVIDEDHHVPADTYRRILGLYQARFANASLVVVTATPERSDRKSLRRVFERIVYQKSLLEMRQAGYLADLRASQV